MAKKAKKSENKMNMAIARVQQLSTRVVGMQLTLGTIIGVLLSMTQLSTGFVFVAGFTDWSQIIPIALIGCLIAILVESLNIGGLGAVRDATTRHKKFLDNYYAMRREPSQQQIENKERKEKEHNKELWAGWSFAGVGILLSVVLGDIFWEKIFSHLNNLWLSVPLSIMVASVITLTFVRNELFHGSLLKILQSILKDNHLMRTAVGVEPQNMEMDMLVSAMATVRNDEEVRQPIVDKFGRVVRKRLSGTADNYAGMSIEVEDAIDGEVKELKQLPAPRKPRGEYPKRKAELQQYLLDNPGAPVRQIAAHFGKSPATIQDWLDKNRAGL